MLGEHDKDFKPRGDSEWFAKLFVCKVCQREWQFYSHFVIKLLILMKTIKKREKPIIAPETELMNCRREEQRVYLISQLRQRINGMHQKLEQEL